MPERRSKLSEAMTSLLGMDPTALSDDRIIGALKKGPLSVARLAEKLRQPTKTVRAYLESMQSRGVLIHQYGKEWIVEKQPHPIDHGLKYTYHSRPNHTYVFGAIGDTHLGSKYERLDMLNELYDRFEAIGVDRVFHAGNWIDGEAEINRHELHTHGLDAQCRYLANVYPQKSGLTTYAVTADCHEGWFAKKMKTDVGRHLEQIMTDEGRDDWRNLGYIEANVPLKNASSGATAHLRIFHPGGGTAYAISYRPQKIVEAMSGGEKPAILLLGHFHKMEFIDIRNVWVCQVGCTQDQCSWTRKKNIEAVIGGWILHFRQDPETGAITEAAGEYIRRFNKGYYNDRWSPYGPVTKSELAK